MGTRSNGLTIYVLSKNKKKIRIFQMKITIFTAVKIAVYLGDNCIQIFHLGRFIVGYTVGNFVLRRRVSGAVKYDFRPYIRRYTSPNEKFEYGYPHSNVLLNFYISKTLYFVQNVSFVSDVNYYVDQSLATLLLTSGFRRYIQSDVALYSQVH